MTEELVGVVDHWFGAINVAGVEITARQLSVGDTIHIVGHTTDFTDTIVSMQLEHEAVLSAGKGDSVGIKTTDRARTGDEVYRVTEG